MVTVGAENLRHNTRCSCLTWSVLCLVTWSFCTWSPVKRKHLGVMSTPMRCLLRALRCFKSITVPVSKRRDRALAMKNYSYLNRWADPIFIDIIRELGCSGDPIGLNLEYSWWVDTLQVHRHHMSNKPMPCVRGVMLGDTRLG